MKDVTDTVVDIAKEDYMKDSSFDNLLPYWMKKALIDEMAAEVRNSDGQVVDAIPANLHSGAYTTAYQSK